MNKAWLLSGVCMLSPLPAYGMVCNGSTDLCDRGYEEVSYPTTHNAFNYVWGPDQFWFANQRWPVTTQLEDGVRALMLDVHPYNGFDASHEGETWVCHSFCWLGGEPLVDVLFEITDFMNSHPNEVITIIFEAYSDWEEIYLAFMEADLLDRTWAQSPGEAWPTLGEMINQNKQLVVFTDHQGGAVDWYMPVWDHAVETHYSAQHPGDLSCEFNRGNPDNDLFILNHFLTYPLARRTLALQVNRNPFFEERALTCEQETGKLPNFVTVDFYDIGDLFSVVRTLNE